jgi:hypothetical protein
MYGSEADGRVEGVHVGPVDRIGPRAPSWADDDGGIREPLRNPSRGDPVDLSGLTTAVEHVAMSIGRPAPAGHTVAGRSLKGVRAGTYADRHPTGAIELQHAGVNRRGTDWRIIGVHVGAPDLVAADLLARERRAPERHAPSHVGVNARRVQGLGCPQPTLLRRRELGSREKRGQPRDQRAGARDARDDDTPQAGHHPGPGAIMHPASIVRDARRSPVGSSSGRRATGSPARISPTRPGARG